MYIPTGTARTTVATTMSTGKSHMMNCLSKPLGPQQGREQALQRLDGIVLEGATDLSAALDRLAKPGFDVAAPVEVLMVTRSSRFSVVTAPGASRSFVRSTPPTPAITTMGVPPSSRPGASRA